MNISSSLLAYKINNQVYLFPKEMTPEYEELLYFNKPWNEH